MKGWQGIVSGGVVLLLISATGWSLFERATSLSQVREIKAALAISDSLALEAEDARWLAERQRDKADELLDELLEAYPELERRAVEIEREKDVALGNLMEARRQERAKQSALEGERTALELEQQQRKLADARADSIDREKRVSDNLRLRQRASVLAQNSMAVKGRPEFRGLMAVQALRSMEMAGGDGTKDDLVLALHAALEELERPAPVRIGGLKRSPHQLVVGGNGGSLLMLGHDARLMRITLDGFRSSVALDRNKELEPGTGRSFLSSDQKALILADPRNGLVIYSTADGTMIAKSQGNAGLAGLRFVATWPDMKGLITADMNGLMQLWRREGERLSAVKEWKHASAIKGLIHDPGTGSVVALVPQGSLLLIGLEGSSTEIPLPQGSGGRCLASEKPGRVVIGTEQGTVILVDLKRREARVLHAESGPRVEVLTASAASGRIAFTNAVKELIIVEPKGGSYIRIPLPAIPGALALGIKEEVYLAYGDRVERSFSSSRAMASRICDILERTWTPAEWKEIGGTGSPEPACAGF